MYFISVIVKPTKCRSQVVTSIHYIQIPTIFWKMSHLL